MVKLTEKTQAALILNDEARIAFIHSRKWVNYTAAQSALDTLHSLLRHPQVHRMPNMLLVSETNNGKTAVIRHFRDSVTPDFDPSAEATIMPVVLV